MTEAGGRLDEHSTLVAILSSGLDSVMRGYETHQRLLYSCLSREQGIDVRLFKRDGIVPSSAEIAMHTPSSSSWVARILGLFRENSQYWQKVFFTLAFGLFCRLSNLHFQRIFVIEPEVVRVLRKIRKLIPGDPEIIYTHGRSDDPKYYFSFTRTIIEVHKVNFERARNKDVGQKNIRLIPHFVETSRGKPANSEKIFAKEEFGLGTGRILLHAGVVCRDPKRVDYIIEEASNLDDEWKLLLVGPIAEGDLIRKARALLGDRFHHTVLPREDMRKAYLAADLAVLASSNEGFGLVILEAMQHWIPIVVPDRPQFRWILKNSECCKSLHLPGALSEFINKEFDDEWARQISAVNASTLNQFYTWKAVRPKYLELIELDRR